MEEWADEGMDVWMEGGDFVNGSACELDNSTNMKKARRCVLVLLCCCVVSSKGRRCHTS